jgi:MerR family transcriptional regulator, light-induced transcriptional regulator
VKYSISDLQRLSGIRSHTIRAWEQRYHALKPTRSKGNTRYYDDRQLRRLLNIATLVNNGEKVSRVCSMPDHELHSCLSEKLQPKALQDTTEEYFIAQLVGAALSFDELRFDKIFAHALSRFGLKKVYTTILYPTLVRIGVMWSVNSLPPLQEHFITNLIRQKLHVAIDSTLPVAHSPQRWVLFLPEGEYHETGLLLANYLIRQQGQQVIYLGANVPLESMESALKMIAPTHLLYFLVSRNQASADEHYLQNLLKKFPDQIICMASQHERKPGAKQTKNLARLHSVEDLEQVLKTV